MSRFRIYTGFLPIYTAALASSFALTSCAVWINDPDSFNDNDVDQTIRYSFGRGYGDSNSALEALMYSKFPREADSSAPIKLLESIGALCSLWSYEDKSSISSPTGLLGERLSSPHIRGALCSYEKLIAAGWNKNPFGRPVIWSNRWDYRVTFYINIYRNNAGASLMYKVTHSTDVLRPSRHY